MVSSESKICRKKGNALRLASTIHPSHNQFRLACEEGEEYPSGHGEEVKVAALSQ